MNATAERRKAPHTVTAAAGDFNLSPEQVRDLIAKPADARYLPARATAKGTGVDGLLVRGAGLEGAINLGRLGSDAHDAIRYDLELPAGGALSVVQWNVYVGNTVPNVRDVLASFDSRGAVDVVAMQEVSWRVATAIAGWADRAGWWYQATAYSGDDREGCVLVARKTKGRRLLDRGVMQMRQDWTGPKQGRRKPPRQFPRLRFEHESGARVRAASLHGPTGGPDGPNAAAVREFCRRTAGWVGR